MNRFRVCLVATAVLIVVTGCTRPDRAATADATIDPMVSVNTLLPAPEEYARLRIGTAEAPIPPWTKFLRGVKIVLDPGHGGDAHRRGFKRGPTGVREAEMNLRVAQYLRDLLVHVGAEVRLTRETDVDLSLAARAGVANEWGADIFISLHHNAVDNKPEVNYTSVWYHADVDHHPANLDLARYLAQGLYDGFPMPSFTDVPLKSDQLMYPAGFGVLSNARVTAALTESSFFSNPAEEQRLRDPAYNLREAHTLFLALARYAAAGLPRVQLLEPSAGVVSANGGPVRLRLDDGLRGRKSWGFARQMILSDSIVVRLDGRRIPHAFQNDGYLLEVELPAGLEPGTHTLDVRFQNMNKNSVLNPRIELRVEPPAGLARGRGSRSGG